MSKPYSGWVESDLGLVEGGLRIGKRKANGWSAIGSRFRKSGSGLAEAEFQVRIR